MNETSYQDLKCLPFWFYYYFKLIFPICIGGHFYIQGWKSSFKKLSDERVNIQNRKTSITRTPMVCLPWPIQTRFLSPKDKFPTAQENNLGIFYDFFLSCHEKCMLCTH